MDNEKQKILLFFYKNLDNIAKLYDGCKLYIDVNNILNVDEPNVLQGIMRYCYNISRKDTVCRLNKLINDIDIFFNAIYIKHSDLKRSNSLENSQKTLFIKHYKITKTDNIHEYTACNTISIKLAASISGIIKLKNTYKDDIHTVKTLQKIIDTATSLNSSLTNMI